MNQQEYQPLNMSTFDQLTTLSNRLYCCWQALLHGDRMVLDHDLKIGAELSEIWCEIEDTLVEEKTIQTMQQEELEKFKQGFAYGRP